MEHENKTRIPAWIRPSTIRRMDGWLEEANCKSRSEFIEKSLHFYMGYLGAEDVSEYLPDELTATLHEIVTGSANRTNSLLFKCAVEQGIMAHTIAAHFGDAMEDRRALRGHESGGHTLPFYALCSPAAGVNAAPSCSALACARYRSMACPAFSS